MSQDLLVQDYLFMGHMRPPVVGSPDSGTWRSKIVKTAGNPSVAALAGLMTLTLDPSQSEVQNVCLYWGDELGLLIDKLVQVDIWAACSASVDSHVNISFGLANARNDAPESITARALFRLSGNNTVQIGAEDTVNTVALTSTGLTLGTTIRRFSINFANGVTTQAGALSTGGKSRVAFYAENSQGLLRHVCPTTLVNLSQYSGGFQIFAQIQKVSDPAAGVLQIQRIRISQRQN